MAIIQAPLEMSKGHYESKVGDYLGYGRGYDFGGSTWTTRQAADISDAVESGLRKFYHQSMSGEPPTVYAWSFLRPVLQVVFASGTNICALPDDVGGVEGNLTIMLPSQSYYRMLKIVGIGEVNKQWSMFPGSTGQPEMICLEPLKGTRFKGGQLQQFYWWPQADQDYTLWYQGYINPGCLTGAMPFAYGGSQHHETILQGCLAVAEMRRDNMVGVHGAEYDRCLQASISIDRRMRAQSLGLNLDSSDGAYWSRRDPRNFADAMTIAGLTPN